jgi:plasmid stability protein
VRSLTIRNLDEATLEWLRRRAKVHGRSLNSEILDLVAVARGDEVAARQGSSAVAGSARRARELGVRTPASSARILRGDRARNVER